MEALNRFFVSEINTMYFDIYILIYIFLFHFNVFFCFDWLKYITKLLYYSIQAQLHLKHIKELSLNMTQDKRHIFTMHKVKMKNHYL